MIERVGHWMVTHTGRRFYVADPRAEDVDIRDIVHALSQVCRFGGQCPVFYSVAQHSVHVADLVSFWGGTLDERRWALLHDAAEAYLGDVIWPLKQLPELAGYKALEQRVEASIAERFGLSWPMPDIVKRADLVVLATEKRDVMTIDPDVAKEHGAASAAGQPWNCDGVLPLAQPISPWSSAFARMQFRASFEDLFAEGGRR